MVPQAVATALGVLERPDRPLSDTLVEFLHAKKALLVVDNCEHLVDTEPDWQISSSTHPPTSGC